VRFIVSIWVLCFISSPHSHSGAVPTQQGGSSFQRNVAPPVEILGVPKTLSSKYGGGAHH